MCDMMHSHEGYAFELKPNIKIFGLNIGLVCPNRGLVCLNSFVPIWDSVAWVIGGLCIDVCDTRYVDVCDALTGVMYYMLTCVMHCMLTCGT